MRSALRITVALMAVLGIVGIAFATYGLLNQKPKVEAAPAGTITIDGQPISKSPSGCYMTTEAAVVDGYVAELNSRSVIACESVPPGGVVKTYSFPDAITIDGQPVGASPADCYRTDVEQEFTLGPATKKWTMVPCEAA